MTVYSQFFICLSHIVIESSVIDEKHVFDYIFLSPIV
jgi:hypothetical protein